MKSNDSKGHRLAKAEVRMVNGRGTLFVDGCSVTPMAHTASWRLTQRLAKQLAEAGIEVYFLWIDCGWHSKGIKSWPEVEQEAKLILEANPNAYIVLRTACHPDYAWLDENPDELEAFEDGRTDHFQNAFVNYFGEDIWEVSGHNRMVCLASRKYAEKASEHIRGLIDFVESSDFGHRVIGYFLVGGGTGEWYYPMAFDLYKHCIGYSPAFKLAYSLFLRKKYGTEENLRCAWQDDNASFDNPHIPSREERKLSVCEYPHEGRVFSKGDWGNFLDPQTSQCQADFYEARTAGTAVTIEYLCKTIKEKTNNRVLAGAFWGNMGCTYYHQNSVTGMKFLNQSPYIDFLSSPSNYEDRVPGGGAGFRSAVDSIHYRGKLWFNESDSTTSLASDFYLKDFGDINLQESLENLKRDFAHVLCDDVQAFWFDMQDGKYRFYDAPEIMALFKKQQALAKEHYDDRRKVSEIAVIYDQESQWYVDQETTKDLTWWNRIFNVPRIGAPCDHIYHEDLNLETLPDYKMYIFMNCFHLDESERSRISTAVKSKGKTVMWVYAAGLINPDAPKQMSVENMQDLTGFIFDADEGPREPTFRIFDTSNELTTGLSPHLLYGRFERPLLGFFNWKRGEIQVIHPSLTSPLIYVNDTQAIILGRFITNNQPAYVVKDFDEWRSVYIGAKVLNPSIIRAVARAAGVHIYLDTDDVLYANDRFVAVQAAKEDTKRICLPRTVQQITDAYTNEVLAGNTDEFEIKISNGETRMFRLQ